MFNQTARQLFDERINKAMEMPPGELVASESELNYAAGMVSYAMFRKDISHEEAQLMHLRIQSARQNRVARLCRAQRVATT
ncbi:hypothetical protein D3C77_42010 [compost metagenome]